LPTGAASVDVEGARQLLEHVRAAGRTILTESESKRLLTAYGIPTVPTEVAASASEAAAIAAQIGYPVVVKLHSETITHKTDVGGVKLNLADESAVRHAFDEIQASVAQRVGAEHFGGVTVQPMISADGYEVIVGSSIDPQFGPVLLFGSGGQLVEVTRDRVLGLPPLTTTLARRMVERTRISQAFAGVRGRKPVDMTALDSLLVRFSQLVVEQRWIKEIDINPLLVSAERLLALDARVVLHDPTLSEAELPHPAIRPYPTQYISRWTMHNGMDVVLRPIRAEDEPLLVDFHGTLSDQSVYFRYFRPLHLDQRVTHERLTRICFIDYNREMALVAEWCDPTTGQPQIIGVGRLTQLPGTNDVEYALLVSDPYQRQGLGTQLLERLIEIGEAEQRSNIVGYVLRENTGMLRVCRRLGFHTQPGTNP
ncbi:MAG TPA: GNAT family N-acetyltransferase, partial [Roseiflexaceae bacterium]|nr:GNAT family N-acetyltransferase [Roseiflexaceae bacterium]